MPLSANTFAFHVTYTCPLTCAHCCFNSSPEVKDSLEPQFILDAIDNLPDDIKLVAFTGGEPFLHGANLVKYVRAVKRRGWRARIVTSAYFGSSVQAASRRLRPMKEVGLDELSISWDDFHEDFVPFERIKNVIQAARDLEIIDGDQFCPKRRYKLDGRENSNSTGRTRYKPTDSHRV